MIIDLPFSAYTRNMHAEALTEPRNYNQEPIDYEIYLINNLDWLHKEYLRVTQKD